MPKNRISEYSVTASSNTDIGGINIAEGCPPSNINNAIRELMAQVKDFQIGAEGDGLTVSTLNATTATFTNLVVPSLGAVTATSLNVSGGSTLASASISGALTTATANITTATIGAIQGTSATLTNALSIASGGTALTTLTAENVILGNGTSAPKFVAPGTTGNVLTSNGTTWTSAAAATGITTTSGSAPYYGARAWINFDGTGTFSPNPSTTKIRASGNVSSVTKNTTGDYTINITTAFSDANYCASFIANDPGTGSNGPSSVNAVTLNSSSLRITIGEGSRASTLVDCDTILGILLG
jgi:hypothetical protein